MRFTTPLDNTTLPRQRTVCLYNRDHDQLELESKAGRMKKNHRSSITADIGTEGKTSTTRRHFTDNQPIAGLHVLYRAHYKSL